jgi:hypothetical protein
MCSKKVTYLELNEMINALQDKLVQFEKSITSEDKKNLFTGKAFIVFETMKDAAHILVANK